MNELYKTKSFVIGALAIVCGTIVLVTGADDKGIGVAMITSGLGTITLRDAIRKGNKK